MKAFVNPYTFVATAIQVNPAAPAGHEQLGDDRFSGTLGLHIKARSPLLLGAVQGSGSQPPVDHAGMIFTPGSALHGAVRAVHETLTGSCMRVIDLDYVPVHREHASTKVTNGLRFARVSGVDAESGRPTLVDIAESSADANNPSVAWFPYACLEKAFGGPVHSGSRFTVLNGTFGGTPARRTLTAGSIQPAAPDDSDAWQILLTDTAARNPDKPVYFAAGRNFTSDAVVTEQAWAEYLTHAAGADDLRKARLSTDEFAPVFWPPADKNCSHPDENCGHHIGYRYRVRKAMGKGQPVWVRLGTGVGGRQVVTEIKPSYLWRTIGSTTIRERLPKDLQPCTDPAALCPACRLFGSADVTVREDDAAARQNSYRGHISFSDVRVVDEPKTREWKLAPLLNPRPSAGQFYLDHSALPDTEAYGRSGEKPLSYWGSRADPRNNPRPIRGRKFYRRTKKPHEGITPRGQARDHHSEAVGAATVTLLETWTTLDATISFDNISLAELGGLIAAAQPELLFRGDHPKQRNQKIVTSLGGGKPFGFGAIETTVSIARIDTAESRYLGAPAAAEIPIAAAIDAFTESTDVSLRDSVWPQLKAVLDITAVENEDVWYPPGTGTKGTKDYDDGFAFWNQSSGRSTDDGTRRQAYRITGPPEATATDQTIPNPPPSETKK